jgi:hypothetical protein
LFLSHSSEEPIVEAFSSSGLVGWLFADLLLSWRNGLNGVCFPFDVWGESLGEVDVFLNFHLGVGIDNLVSEKFSIFLLGFLVDFTPCVHDITSFIEFGCVPLDISDDWDGSKVCERHYYEMFFLIFII